MPATAAGVAAPAAGRKQQASGAAGATIPLDVPPLHGVPLTAPTLATLQRAQDEAMRRLAAQQEAAAASMPSRSRTRSWLGRRRRSIEQASPQVQPPDTANTGSGGLGSGLSHLGSKARLVDLPKGRGDMAGLLLRQGDGFDRTSGIFVSRVEMGSLAAENGVQVGNEILAIGDVAVEACNVAWAEHLILHLDIASLRIAPPGYCPPQASTPAQPQVAAPAPRTPAPTDRPAPSPAFSPSSASQRTPHLPQASLASADTSLPVQRTVASTHEPPAWTATSANNNSRFRASPSSPSIGSSPHSLASGPSHAQPVFVERTQPILRSQSDMHFDRQRPRSVQFHPATMPTATTAPAPDDLLALQPTRARGAPPSVSSSLLAAPLEPDLTSSRRHSWSTWGGGARTDSYTPHLHGRHPEPSPVEDELDQLLADFRSARYSPPVLDSPQLPPLYAVELVRDGTSGLGLRVVGGADTVFGALHVGAIDRHSPADACRQLQIGDRLVAVQGLSCAAMTQTQLASTLAAVPREQAVLLQLQRFPRNAFHTLLRASAVRAAHHSVAPTAAAAPHPSVAMATSSSSHSSATPPPPASPLAAATTAATASPSALRRAMAPSPLRTTASPASHADNGASPWGGQQRQSMAGCSNETRGETHRGEAYRGERAFDEQQQALERRLAEAQLERLRAESTSLAARAAAMSVKAHSAAADALAARVASARHNGLEAVVGPIADDFDQPLPLSPGSLASSADSASTPALSISSGPSTVSCAQRPSTPQESALVAAPAQTTPAQTSPAHSSRRPYTRAALPGAGRRDASDTEDYGADASSAEELDDEPSLRARAGSKPVELSQRYAVHTTPSFSSPSRSHEPPQPPSSMRARTESQAAQLLRQMVEQREAKAAQHERERERERQLERAAKANAEAAQARVASTTAQPRGKLRALIAAERSGTAAVEAQRAEFEREMRREDLARRRAQELAQLEQERAARTRAAEERDRLAAIEAEERRRQAEIASKVQQITQRRTSMASELGRPGGGPRDTGRRSTISATAGSLRRQFLDKQQQQQMEESSES